MTGLLKHSPFSLQRRFYQESLLKYGGFHNSTKMPKETMDKIQAGEAVTVAVHTLLPMYKHVIVMSKEDDIFFSYLGYYAAQKLPLLKEIREGLLHFIDCGITEEVRARTNWHLEKPWRDLQRTKTKEAAVLGLGHISPMLILLSILLSIIAVIFFTFESRLFSKSIY